MALPLSYASTESCDVSKGPAACFADSAKLNAQASFLLRQCLQSYLSLAEENCYLILLAQLAPYRSRPYTCGGHVKRVRQVLKSFAIAVRVFDPDGKNRPGAASPRFFVSAPLTGIPSPNSILRG